MKAVLLVIVGLSLAIISCAGQKKASVVAKYEEFAKAPTKEERVEPLKRHKRW